MQKIVLFLLVICCVVSCGEDSSNSKLKYNLGQPDLKLDLDDRLMEISGLEYVNEKELYCVIDERGVVYVISTETGEILRSHEFDAEGDYEGITIGENDTVYAIQSDGDIFKLHGMNGEAVDDVWKFETDLDEDCEGIIYDFRKKRFLISAKDKETDTEWDRAIYSISPKLEKDSFKVEFPIMVDSMKKFVITNSFDEFAYQVNDAITTHDNGGLLAPSGIAWHPIEHRYYVLSGTSSILMVLDSTGVMIDAISLPVKYLPQPEGIAIAPNGDLYISSEKARLRHATLLKFNYNDK